VGARRMDVLGRLHRKRGNRGRTRYADDGPESLIAKHGRSIGWRFGEVNTRSRDLGPSSARVRLAIWRLG